MGVTKAYVWNDPSCTATSFRIGVLLTRRKDRPRRRGRPRGPSTRKASDYRALATKTVGNRATRSTTVGSPRTTPARCFRSALGSATHQRRGPDGISEAGVSSTCLAMLPKAVYITSCVGAPKLTGKGAYCNARLTRRSQREPEGYSSYAYESMKVALNSIATAGQEGTARRSGPLSSRPRTIRWRPGERSSTRPATVPTRMSWPPVVSASFDEDNSVCALRRIAEGSGAKGPDGRDILAHNCSRSIDLKRAGLRVRTGRAFLVLYRPSPLRPSSSNPLNLSSLIPRPRPAPDRPFSAT